MKTALNGRKNNITTMEFMEQMRKEQPEPTSHEITVTGSNVCISRATSPDRNHIIPPTFGTGKPSASLPTIAFGVLFLNNLIDSAN